MYSMWKKQEEKEGNPQNQQCKREEKTKGHNNNQIKTKISNNKSTIKRRWTGKLKAGVILL